MWLFLSLLVILLLTGCGGFRGGLQSVPHIDSPNPHAEESLPSWPHHIALPLLTLKLSLNNVLRTYQYEVMLFFIPTYFNFWDEFTHRDAQALELSFQVIANDSSITLDPRELVLTVDGRRVRPSSVRINNPTREREILDAYIAARRQAPAGQAPPIPRASDWQDTITEPVAVSPKAQSPRFIVTFPLPLLSPEKEVVLNINHAVLGPKGFNAPPIRFQPKSWSEGYS
jgi:hypothetical protein